MALIKSLDKFIIKSLELRRKQHLKNLKILDCRWYLGNKKKPPICCPCHPPTKMGFNNRLNKKKDAVNAIKFARRNIINRMF